MPHANRVFVDQRDLQLNLFYIAMSSSIEDFYILGAGSIGLMLAAHLSRVSPVVLIRRPGHAAPELRFRFREADTESAVTLPQLPADALDAPVRRMIVCTGQGGEVIA